MPPDLLIAVMAVANRVHAGRPLVGCGLILDRGIKGQKQNVEVTAIDGRQSAPDVAGEDQPPKARSRWQAHQAVGNQAVKDGKAKEQALVQGPALGCSLTRKRDGIPNSAHDVLLRHRPRSISPRRGVCQRHGSREYRPIPSGRARCRPCSWRSPRRPPLPLVPRKLASSQASWPASPADARGAYVRGSALPSWSSSCCLSPCFSLLVVELRTGGFEGLVAGAIATQPTSRFARVLGAVPDSSRGSGAHAASRSERSASPADEYPGRPLVADGLSLRSMDDPGIVTRLIPPSPRLFSLPEAATSTEMQPISMTRQPRRSTVIPVAPPVIAEFRRSHQLVKAGASSSPSTSTSITAPALNDQTEAPPHGPEAAEPTTCGSQPSLILFGSPIGPSLSHSSRWMPSPRRKRGMESALGRPCFKATPIPAGGGRDHTGAFPMPAGWQTARACLRAQTTRP